MLEPDGVNYWAKQAYLLGQLKVAGDSLPAYNLSGLLYVSETQGKPWGLLSVPNALVRGIFDAMTEPGVELPLNGENKLNAHITVFRDTEITMLGGADALKNDRGKPFRYTLGRLLEISPDSPGINKVFACLVYSPELQALRRSHGLASLPNDGKYPFHITVGVQRKGVLARNEKSKNPLAA